eukprot:scaffold285_cov330-Pavlova_lutheri.AAC.79
MVRKDRTTREGPIHAITFLVGFVDEDGGEQRRSNEALRGLVPPGRRLRLRDEQVRQEGASKAHEHPRNAPATRLTRCRDDGTQNKTDATGDGPAGAQAARRALKGRNVAWSGSRRRQGVAMELCSGGGQHRFVGAAVFGDDHQRIAFFEHDGCALGRRIQKQTVPPTISDGGLAAVGRCLLQITKSGGLAQLRKVADVLHIDFAPTLVRELLPNRQEFPVFQHLCREEGLQFYGAHILATGMAALHLFHDALRNHLGQYAELLDPLLLNDRFRQQGGENRALVVAGTDGVAGDPIVIGNGEDRQRRPVGGSVSSANFCCIQGLGHVCLRQGIALNVNHLQILQCFRPTCYLLLVHGLTLRKRRFRKNRNHRSLRHILVKLHEHVHRTGPPATNQDSFHPKLQLFQREQRGNFAPGSRHRQLAFPGLAGLRNELLGGGDVRLLWCKNQHDVVLPQYFAFCR